MARLKDLAVSTRDGFNIDPRIIEIEPGFNARDFTIAENIEHVETLMASIGEGGLKVPLTVRLANDKVLLTDGESRWRAVMKLIEQGIDIKTVPCQAEERHANEADRTANMLLRNTGKQLSMLEQGAGYKKLLAYGWTEADIAKKIGLTVGHIQNCLLVAGSSIEVQNAVRSGAVASTTAVQEIKRSGEAAGAVLTAAVEQAAAEGRKKVSGASLKREKAKRGISHDQCQILLTKLERIVDEYDVAEAQQIAKTGANQLRAWL
jgi:ParB/RepB/Spo0J family partition protein